MERDACGSSSKDCECGMFRLATETLLDIVSYLTAYERLCLRITCKRFYSILSDSRAWHTLVWRDCRKKDSDFKALRLALRLSRSSVQNISILYRSEQKIPFSKFLPQVHNCKQVRYLTLSGRLHKVSMVNELLSQLPSLYFFSITVGLGSKDCWSIVSTACALTKNLEILQIVADSSCTTYSNVRQVLDTWQACKYFPPYLQVCSNEMATHGFSLGMFSKSDHPAKLSIYPKCSSVAGSLVSKYPLLEIVLYPNVEIPSCVVCPTSPDSPQLALSKGMACGQDEFISAMYLRFLDHSFLTENSLPSLPSTIQSLNLAGLDELTSADLSSISECCPNLRCLNIKGCPKALLSLSGLADISEKCPLVTSLNIQSISEVESVATLWEVIAGMRKLRHLAMNEPLLSPEPPLDEHSLSSIRSSVRKMSLTAFETSKSSLQLDILLPAFRWLTHLRLSGSIPELSNILPYIPQLTQLALLNTCGNNLPTDPLCYSSLKQIYISGQDVSEEVVQALDSVTHMCLYHAWFVSPYQLFRALPRLCDLRAYVLSTPSGPQHIFLTPKMAHTLLDSHGICGYVSTHHHSSELDVDIDLQSLWPDHY